MASSWTTDRFPQFEDEVRRLTTQHLELKDQPLHLAISYDPGRDSQDIFLFEVIGGFAGGEINPDGDFFETVFPSTSTIPPAEGDKLHLVLTSPDELGVAVEQGWPLAVEIKSAVQRGDFQELFHDETGARLLESLRE